MSNTFGYSLPCGYSSCMAGNGLFDGVSREEKQAMRAADRADRQFRAQKGYDRDTLLHRLKTMLRINN